MKAFLFGYLVGAATRPQRDQPRPQRDQPPRYQQTPAPPLVERIDERELRDQAITYGWRFPEEFDHEGVLIVDTERLYNVCIKYSRTGRFDMNTATWIYPNHVMRVTRAVDGTIDAVVLGCNRS